MATRTDPSSVLYASTTVEKPWGLLNSMLTGTPAVIEGSLKVMNCPGVREADCGVTGSLDGVQPGRSRIAMLARAAFRHVVIAGCSRFIMVVFPRYANSTVDHRFGSGDYPSLSGYP
jgi:hypothetical protein